MKIPDKMMIGAIEFEIKNELEEIVPSEYNGSCNATHALIILHADDKRAKTKTEQVFFHELIHAILDSLGYNSGMEPYDEVFIESVSLLLHQAISQIIKAQ
jgi:hypothetical protein